MISSWFVNQLARLPHPAVLLLGAGLVFLVGVLDYLTGYQFGCSIFYLIPVLLVSWATGCRPGILIAVLAAATWLLADLVEAHRYSHPLLPYWNACVRLSVFVITAIIVTRLRRERDLARTDLLTGIANRHAFIEAAEIELDRCRRYLHPLTLAYLDCDDFKTVNDRGGHAAGDALLRATAAILRANLRRPDVVARLGGDEFALLLPETSPEAASSLILKIQGLLRGLMGKERYPVTFSMGVVTYVAPAESVDAMVRKADALMYAAKAGGKNSVRMEVVGPAGAEGAASADPVRVREGP